METIARYKVMRDARRYVVYDREKQESFVLTLGEFERFMDQNGAEVDF